MVLVFRVPAVVVSLDSLRHGHGAMPQTRGRLVQQLKSPGEPHSALNIVEPCALS